MSNEAKKRESLRRAVLNVLEANNTRFGLGIDAVTLFTSHFGFPQLESKTLEPELEYLVEKKLIAEVSKTVSPENRAWKITAEGRDFLAAGGI